VVLARDLLQAQGMPRQMTVLSKKSIEIGQVEGLSFHFNKIITSLFHKGLKPTQNPFIFSEFLLIKIASQNPLIKRHIIISIIGK
jgi:hypothetical protein